VYYILIMPYYNKMRIFTVLPNTNTNTNPLTKTSNLVKPPPPSIEEQEKELLYWESQFETLFDNIEKKRQDKLNRPSMYRNMFSINLQTHHQQ